ncbi:MAG: Hint domain-containing protein [Rhodobacteraceae bacterium]|nr:Hint domain-containing protein [Paracoccaceae bacterium]
MPVFALYNFDDPSCKAIDSALTDGAQDGLYLNGARSVLGRAVLDGNNDLVKIGTDPAFQLDSGTLEIQFSLDDDACLTKPSTILSRDSKGVTEGGFRIESLPHGIIQITHESPAGTVVYRTECGFQNPGDEIAVSYSWDQGGDGGVVKITNLTTADSFEDTVPNHLTMDQGSINQNWLVGAGQQYVNAGSVCNINAFYPGSVEYLSISDTVDNVITNQVPDAVDDAFVTPLNTPIIVDVLANDTDPDGDALTVTSITQPANGTATLGSDGTILFTPESGFAGDTTLTYTLSDGKGGTDSATVTFTVNPPPPPPPPPAPDGIVEGTATDDLIDLAYTGDPDGDRIDNDDAVLPGEGPQDDIVQAYGGNDTVFSGLGDDKVTAGDGDDLVYGGDGDDLLSGGTGDDSLHGDAGRDTLFGDDGDDTMAGDDDDDVLSGGIGDDSLDGGLGADSLAGNDGDDVLLGSDGDDTIAGGAGDDTIDGGAQNDLIDGGTGNDLILGDAGQDTLIGGTGSDTLFGGADDDLIALGEAVTGAPDGAADQAFGGADRDTFVGVGAGDTVFGGSDGDDFDTLDLGGTGPCNVVRTNVDSDGNGFDGYVEYLDLDGAVVGRSDFSNIESIVCFTPGTLIATPRGEVAVEDLRVGDKVITRDNGIQEIRWMGAKAMGWHDFAANPHLRPIMVKAGSLGNDLPERDMMLSPNHRLLVANDRTALYFDEHEVLVAAKHLIGGKGVQQVESVGTTYYHFMFDQHEVVLSNGAWTESFQPGDYTLKGLGNAQRSELLELFPELKAPDGVEAYQAARKTLKKHEARLLAR